MKKNSLLKVFCGLLGILLFGLLVYSAEPAQATENCSTPGILYNYTNSWATIWFDTSSGTYTSRGLSAWQNSTIHTCDADDFKFNGPFAVRFGDVGNPINQYNNSWVHIGYRSMECFQDPVYTIFCKEVGTSY